VSSSPDGGSGLFRVDGAAHPKLEYRVQYGETDFDFLLACSTGGDLARR
jgi:hypothetical protein